MPSKIIRKPLLYLVYLHFEISISSVYTVWGQSMSPNIFEELLMQEDYINPYHSIGLFRYPLKTLENPWFSDVFRGVLKETSGMKWVKEKSWAI